MKSHLGLIIVLLCFGGIFLLPFLVKSTKSPIVDLPEEYKAISRDSLHPDTMLCHSSGDTIYLYFKH